MSRQPVHKHILSGGPPIVVPRRGTLALRRSKLVRRRLRMGIYTIGTCLCLGAIGHAAYGFFVAAPYFKVNAIQVEGVSEPITLEVLGLVEDQLAGQRNILGISTTELERRISRHPRVRDLHIARHFPDTLAISANEREPAALLLANKAFYLLDWDAQVVAQMEVSDIKDLELPFISGVAGDSIQVGEKLYNSSLEKALYLIRVLKERNTSLYEKVDTVSLAGGDSTAEIETISMHLTEGLNVKFGDGDPVKKLPALETLVNKLKQDGVDAYNDLEYIDMRFDGRAYCMDRKTMEDQATGKWDAVIEAMEHAPPVKRNKESQEETGPEKPRAPERKAAPAKPGRNQEPQGTMYNLPQQPRN